MMISGVHRGPSKHRVALAVLLLLLHLKPSVLWPVPWAKTAKPDISSAARCRAASEGHVYQGDSIYPPLQHFFNIDGPVVQLPPNITDITTAATLIQLALTSAQRELRLVLDPLLYLKATQKTQHIPRLIHMTLRSKHSLAPHQILSIISWGWYHKGYALLLYDDADIDAYMQQYYPAFMTTFKQLKTPVEKSDAWRYHVLCGHGGVYADTDTICARPLESWTRFNTSPEPGLIVGVEQMFHSQQEAEEAAYVRRIQMVQWTMAAKKSHPVVCRMGNAIKARVLEEKAREEATGKPAEQQHGHDASILLRTGPGIWSKEVHAYLRQLGSNADEVAEGGRVEDVVVLSQAGFGCNWRYWHKRNNASVVYHMFNNSWKVDHYKVADAKKLARQARDQAMMQRQLMLYPMLFAAALFGGMLVAVCSTWCRTASTRLRVKHHASANRSRRRPFVVGVLASSPRSSPKASSRSPGGASPTRKPGGGSNLQGGRCPQQHQQHAALHLLSPRKPARLLH